MANNVQRAADVIRLTFARTAKAMGYEERSEAWYRVGESVVSVLHLQKSQFGPRYYVNLAVWFRALGDEKYPKERQCHLRTRLEEIVTPEQAQRLDSLLDCEHPVDEDVRAESLNQFFHESLGWFSSFASLDDFRSPAAPELLQACLLTGPAAEFLDQT